MDKIYEALARLDLAYNCGMLTYDEYREDLAMINEWGSEVQAEEASVRYYERDAESWECEFGDNIAY